jgi:ribosomal subunit interface protein
VDIVVRGRNVEVPEHFRQHVEEKLARIERYDSKIFRIDVELLHEKNPRQSDNCQRIELTCRTRGPVVRAEACAADFYAALDQAVLRAERRFRQAADRRRIHHGRHAPVSVAAATGSLPTDAQLQRSAVAVADRPEEGRFDADLDGGQLAVDDAAQLVADEALRDDTVLHVVRDKVHQGTAMSLDQALFEMELVGHDFYLFQCADTDLPSVVYRRKGYDYGVIRLAVGDAGSAEPAQ